MTASTTRSCTSVRELLALRLLAALLVVLPLFARAGGEVRYAEIVRDAGGYVVNADVELELNPRLIDAVMRGVSLHFAAEFVIERPRWYWFDEVIVERSLNYRLSYHAITRSYRLTIGNLHQSFETLDAALRTMQRIRNWHIVDADALEPGVSYHAALRLRHDTSMLPRPFQVTTLGNRDWSVGTGWLHWIFLPGLPR
ncbi:MAG TPA: DUF4390 domain-containing protein [Rhodocyclaceae bacterium]|nr:DUF4390 domain-containing protein [Rhodocyclaceae bacterium]